MTRCPNRPGSVRKRRRDSGACGTPRRRMWGRLPMVVAVPVFERCRRLSFVIARPNSAQATLTRRCQCPAPLGQHLRVVPERLRGSEVALSGATAAPGIVGHELGGREAHVFGDIGDFSGEGQVREVRHGRRV